MEDAFKIPKPSTKLTIAGKEYPSKRAAAKVIGVDSGTLKARLESGRDPFTGK